MPVRDLERIVRFRLSFARRQAAVVTEVSGGVVVLDPAYPASHEHNQLLLEQVPVASDIPELADKALGHLRYRRITVLDDTAGLAIAPVLTAAGYAHETELIMVHSGPAATPGSPLAQPIALAELRPALVGQLRRWMPYAEDTVIHQLADRRAARLSGAEQVVFLAVRDERGAIGSWADLYLDSAEQIAQIEDVVTADTHLRRGYADTVLATALHHAQGYRLVFLVTDADDWPHTWYARRGFTPIGRSHTFTRTPTAT